MFITILIFLLILGLLVFVHEFGHFYAATKSGMKVEEFGFGFPPRMFGIQIIDGTWNVVWGHKPPLDNTKTVYSINWIPLGGFVRILGENNENEDDPRSFVNASFTGRLVTLIAGVTMNVILAWFLISVGYMSGLPAALSMSDKLPAHSTLKDVRVTIVETVAGGPADTAGVKAGDSLMSIDSIPTTKFEEVHDYIQENAGKDFTFVIKRGSEQKELVVHSRSNPGPNEGSTGIVLDSVGRLSFPWYWAPIEGLRTTIMQIKNITVGLYDLVTAKIGLGAVGGPVKIAKLTGEVADLGFVYLLQFAAFLSLNLAILNILPFPALDGGRVLFLIIEKIRGKKNNQKFEQIVNTAGFVCLLLLMAAVTAKDIFGK